MGIQSHKAVTFTSRSSTMNSLTISRSKILARIKGTRSTTRNCPITQALSITAIVTKHAECRQMQTWIWNRTNSSNNMRKTRSLRS